MTYETYYDKSTDKEIHYVLFPDDPFTGSPCEIEIRRVYKDNKELFWSNQEAAEWTDEILREVTS